MDPETEIETAEIEQEQGENSDNQSTADLNEQRSNSRMSSRHHTSGSGSCELARPDFNSDEEVEFIAGFTPAVREMIEPDTELRRCV